MRLIDLDDSAHNHMCYNGEYEVWSIDTEKTVEAEPVIRCKDCKFLRFTGTVWKCQNRLVMMLCEPNDYCSRGERKEE